MMNKALYPGSFDPFTKGHENIVKKALSLFNEIIIGVGQNSEKKYYFSLESRLNHIKSLFVDEKRVKIISYNGLTVDFCKEINTDFIIRGLRNNKDFDFEYNILMNNKILNENIETIFLCSDLNLSPIQSSIVREIHKSGGDINFFVTNYNLLRLS